MNEPSENITDQPGDGPRSTDFTNEPPRGADAYPLWQIPPPKSISWRRVALVGGGIFIVLVLVFGLVIAGVAKVREAAARVQSSGNCKQMCLAVYNITTNSKNGEIPPAYGTFPAGSNTSASFFVHLLPYIEHTALYDKWNQYTFAIVKTYIAPADPNNPASGPLISYGSNATVLTVGGTPTFPKSFNSRTSATIVVFERTAASGATWSNNKSYLTDTNGSSSPEFSGPNSWCNYGTRATALTSAGCIVGMADGSSRIVSQSSANAGWAWAMDPSIGGSNSQPSGW